MSRIIQNNGLTIASDWEYYVILREYWPRWRNLHTKLGFNLRMQEYVITEFEFELQFTCGPQRRSFWQELFDDIEQYCRAWIDCHNCKEVNLDLKEDLTVYLCRADDYELNERHQETNIRFVTGGTSIFEIVELSYEELKTLSSTIESYAKVILDERNRIESVDAAINDEVVSI